MAKKIPSVPIILRKENSSFEIRRFRTKVENSN